MNKTIVVNLFGGPGTAKSIFCALIFAKLKLEGVNCEMAREYAKDEVWAGSSYLLENQQGVYGEQQKRLYVLDGKVTVAVTDAPLMNSIIYDKLGKGADVDFRRTVKNEFNRYDNRNYVLKRVMGYEQEGRTQDEEGAKLVDKMVFDTLDEYAVKYKEFSAYPENADVIAREILLELKS